MMASGRSINDVPCDPAAIVVRNPPWVSAACADARAFARVVAERVRPGQRVLDLGTGTGILAIVLAKAGIDVAATDISAAAVRTARGNAARNGVCFDCYRSDLLKAVEGRFDLIAFNPPYNVRRDTLLANIAKNLLRRIPWVQRNCGRIMPPAVLRFHQQLVRRIAEEAPPHLTPGGCVMLHAYAAEAEAWREVLPAGFSAAVVEHPALREFGTVAVVMYPPAGSTG
ncbi:MAG: methyltransferase [Phycisphaerae bacterium]